MPKKVSLFNDESDEEREDFKINEDYAKNYDRWRRSEELSKLKAQGITEEEEDSSSDSSDEDGDGKNLAKPDNPEFDREFLLSLGTLYKIGKGEKVKVKNVQFFKGDYRVETEKKEKPLTLKDLERQVILEREGKYEDDEVDSTNRGNKVQDAKKISFDDGLDDSEDDDGDGLLNSGLFKVKEQSDSGTKEEKNNAPGTKAVDFVKGLTSSLPESEDKDILESVKSAWTDKKLPKKEKWLVDFFLNQRYLEDDTGAGSTYNEKFLEEEELTDESESEEDNPLAAQHKYRHQEPGDILKRHPRHISDTLRPKDEKRKEKREAAKERKLAKKEEKRQEIEMLKTLKYKEIEEKIDRIREASGNEEIDLGTVDLDEDFDPAEHDKYMEQMFGEDYYDPTNAEQELPEFEEEEDDTKTYDNWTRPSTSHTGGNYEEKGEEEEAFTEDNEIGDYNEFQQFEDSEIKQDKKTTRRKGRRNRSKFARAVDKEKPAFDPKEKDFASYFDEYYQLDFEDVVGGIPCRFKYRNVEPNSFGLTTGEILAAQNSDLNKWVGIKKILKYNRTKEEEQKDRVYYDNRSLYEHVKRKVMPSLFTESQEELANQEREKRRLKNLKRKQKRWMVAQGLTEMPENMEVVEEKPTNENGKRPREDDQEVALQSSSVTSNEEVLNMKKKKKKNKKNSSTEVDSGNDANNDKMHTSVMDCLDKPTLDDDADPKKKKKKKKNKKESNTEVNSGNDENDANNDIMHTSVMDCLDNTALNNDVDPKKKKKKKKRKASADITENTSSMNESLEMETEESKIQVKAYHSTVLHKKKKKKQSEKAEECYDNAANNITKKGKNKVKMSRKINDKKKDHNRKHDKATEYFKGISDARLEAYGQNPKKLKNRIKYGKDV